MKTKMNTLSIALTALALEGALSPLHAAVSQISAVDMAQSSSSRLVTITYTLADAPAVVTVDVQTNANTSAAANDPGWASIGGAAVWNAQGDVWRKVGNDLAEGQTFSGTITWRPDHSWPDHKIADGGARAVVTAWALDNTPDYMAVDVSAAAQPDTQTYYPAADFVPGGVTNSIYKTTKLLMRKIMAKDVEWTMGSTALETQSRQAAREATHQVKLANNYYIGVYAITQSQWSQVATNSSATANFTAEGFMRPMEKVSYNEIRNTHSTSASASSVAAGTLTADPSSDSFLGLLRSKTGVDFDLPSEAQWEFAARAGNGVGYWGDGTAILNKNPDANLSLLGRYKNNPTSNSSESPAATIAPSEGGTAIVGTYDPNAWCIYDMQGNVWEWCLDWYQEKLDQMKDANGVDYGGRVNIDPSNPANYLSGESTSSSATRVVRGGSWGGAAGACRPAYRSYTPASRRDNSGFRVLCSAGLR